MRRLSEEVGNSSVKTHKKTHRSIKLEKLFLKKHQGSGASLKSKKQQQQFEKHFSF